jgi:predicted protein tyrosine phosphatase
MSFQRSPHAMKPAMNRPSHLISSDPELTVCSWEVARDLLRQKKTWPVFDCAISIGDPESKGLPGFRFIPYRLRLEFDDVEEVDENGDVYQSPSESDVQEIVDFARLAKSRGDKRILIHCQQGRSRSVAAAFIFLCAWYGPGNEEKALRQVIESCDNKEDELIPNELMIDIADDLLHRQEKMLDALDKFFPDD